MQYALTIPNFGWYFDPRLAGEMAYEAEQAGWDGFFFWDHMHWGPFPAAPVADPWMLLTAAALRTERVRLGTMITPLSRRRPVKLARETLTLDHLSHGRLILGVGLGYFQKEEFEGFGEVSDLKERGKIMDESLEVLCGLWSGAPFEHHGKHFTVEPVQFSPASVQKPRIPVWVAGQWPNKAPFRRAARWDCAFPIPLGDQPLTSSDFAEIVAFVQAQRAEKAGPIDFAASGWTSGEDKAKDRDLVEPLRAAGATWWMESFDPWRFDLEAARKRVRLGPPRS